MTETIHRCFFHELGHYVADELKKRFFGGLGTEQLSIYPCANIPDRFCGCITPTGFNPDYNAPPPFERLASSLISIIYGCLFEAYYLKSISINECIFNRTDAGHWRGTLEYYKIYDFDRFINIHEAYFTSLQMEDGLKDFFSLEPLDFLKTSDSITYFADLGRLNAAIAGPLKNHQAKYKQLVADYQKLID